MQKLHNLVAMPSHADQHPVSQSQNCHSCSLPLGGLTVIWYIVPIIDLCQSLTSTNCWIQKEFTLILTVGQHIEFCRILLCYLFARQWYWSELLQSERLAVLAGALRLTSSLLPVCLIMWKFIPSIYHILVSYLTVLINEYTVLFKQCH